jgi:hypothetical protein
MADATAEARQQLAAARGDTQAELDKLAKTAQAALDFPAKIKRHPVRTVGVLSAAAFMLLGGPKRSAKAAERRFFPERANRPPTLLPKDLDKTLKRLPEDDAAQIRGHLERDFAAYLQKEHVTDAATGRQSFWKTYDLLVSVVGASATRELVRRAVAVPNNANLEPTPEEAQVVAQMKQAADSNAIKK